MATFDELYNHNGVILNDIKPSIERPRYKTLSDGSVEFYFSQLGNKHGTFTADNPFVQQLKENNNRSDISALWEMATKWEADRANLVEQREYDSPLSVIQRQREAGINPDISGSSSAPGGSSSSAMPATQSDIRMSNPLDEAQMDALKHQTVLGYVNSAVNLATGVIGGISQLSMLPSQLAISKAGAQVATATAADSIQLSSDLLKAQKLNNASQLISNTSATAAHIGSLAKMFTPETTDEDMTAMLTALGTPQEMIVPYSSAIRQAQTNPNVQAYFEQGERQAREAKAYNDVYSPAIVHFVTENAFKYQLLKQQTDIFTQSLEKLVAEYTSTDENARNISSALTLGNEADKYSADLRLRSAKHDVDVFDYNCKQLANIVLDIRLRKQKLLDSSKDGKLTALQQATYDSMSVMEQQVLGLGSSAVGNAFLILSKVYQNSANYEYNIDSNGDLNDLYQQYGPGNKFIESTFSNSYFDNDNPFAAGASVGAGVGSILWNVIKFAITKKP